ncbi:hypothetical protein DPMN_192662 [Dreissena polymorpha]|uniref:G-patch domain-containing protein n=1 Tax=Dreissena polymorpha TaxID=45954 RepID=A0A9D4BH22_DREPO|nr:hypothetical protein DPMN_192662 [Dreissena polymorpha]
MEFTSRIRRHIAQYKLLRPQIAPNVLLTDEGIEYRLKLEYQAYVEAEGNFLRELGITKEDEPLPQTIVNGPTAMIAPYVLLTDERIEYRLKLKYKANVEAERNFLRELDVTKEDEPLPQTYTGCLVYQYKVCLGEENKGHMQLRKMGMYTWDRGGEQGTYAAQEDGGFNAFWGGKGLGAKEQGIVNPIEAAEFRKNKAQGFIIRMQAREIPPTEVKKKRPDT